MTTQPAQRRMHPALSMTISVSIIIGLFIIVPTIAEALSDWMVYGS